MIEITPAAREKIQSLVEADIVRDPALRIQLDSDARTPLARSYAISLVEREDRQKTEIAINVEGIRVFLNLDTSNLLSGATVDWVEENGSTGFRISDPNAKPAAAPAPRAGGSGTPSDPLAERVQEVIDELINPRIAAHGGAVEMVDVEDNVLYLRMSGGCQGCAASAATLRMGIERMVKESIPEIQGVVDVTDHTAGVNPYY
ncbi:MAG: NifU family protein [Gemmatimonadota bacterium]|nr:NifU family protein [Gemmatimonadota bacterium]